MTKSPFTTHSELKNRCAAQVSYKSRQGPCKREGKYPDTDGVRWWCGLHDPSKKKAEKGPAKAKPVTEPIAPRPSAVVEVEVSPDVSSRIVMVDELVTALQAAQGALAEVANTKDNGWPDNTPVENYRTILKHLNDNALAASQAAAAALRMVDKMAAKARAAS
jgi:hypothetical protein